MHIKIRPSFLLYLGSIAILVSPWACVGAVAALVVHEISHLIVSRVIGERIDSLELTPFGGVMTYAVSPHKGLHGLFVALAGPLSNYAMLLLLPKISRFLPLELLRQLTLSNAAMMLVNLLPAFPLDGGRMVFSVGYYIFGVSALTRVLTGLGVLAGFLMIAFGFYSAIMLECLNLSILIVGFYLITCAVKSRAALLSENLYALIQERMDAPKDIQATCFYMVPEEIKIYKLIDKIGSCSSAMFITKRKEDVVLLHEQEILTALLSDPKKTVSFLLDEKLHKIAEKEPNFQ